MSRFVLSLTLVAGLTAALLSVQAGEAKKGDKETKRPKETEANKAVQNIGLADQLIDYGIANKDPGSLLVAAEILHNNPVKNDDKADLVFKEENYEKTKEENSQERTPQTILNMAKKMAKELKTKEYDSQIKATTKKLNENPRSPYPGGCFVRNGHLHGGERVTYYVHCHGHTHANVYPHFPNNNVDLDIYVYDRFNNLIRYDRSTSPSARVHFDGDGDFRIVVHMYSGGHCDYTLRVS